MRPLFAAYLGLFLWAAMASPAGAELPPLVEAAFAHASGCTGGWAYTRTTAGNGKASVERFDPAGGDDGWTLIEVNGKTPSKKQLDKYVARRDRRESRDHPGEVDFGDIVDVGTIALVEETAEVATYSFKPAPDEDDEQDPSAFLVGTMTIDKSGPFVESLELASVESFSPATGVKIKKMRVTMDFIVIDGGARIALREMSQSVEGRLFGIKRVSDSSAVTYSDFGPQD